MDKYIVVAPGSAVPGPGGEEGARMMARHVAAALELGCAGLVVNLLDPDGRGPREEQPTPDEEARVLGATEIWVADGTVVDRARFGDDWVYRVDGHRPKARAREWDLGAPSPGVKTIFGVTRQAAGRDEFRKAWLEGHVPLALRHHVGMCAYETDVVIDDPPGAPVLDGFSQLHFASEEDFTDRFYDDAAGKAAIEADVAGFVASATAWGVDEFVLVDPPAAL
jgi:uncharacterized protein (TIGR02118 family)